MPKLSGLLLQARERMGPELAAQLNAELHAASVEMRRDVLEKGWFGEPVTPETGYDAPSIETPQLKPDNALYEDVWGEEPEREELYGSRNVEPGDVIAPPETPTIEADEPEPEL